MFCHLIDEGTSQSNVFAGCANIDVEYTRLRHEGMCIDIPYGQIAVLECEGDNCGRGGLEAELAEAFQLHWGLGSGHRETKIQLWHLPPDSTTDIRDGGGHCASFNHKIAVGERGVAQTMAESKLGLDVMSLVPAVPDLEPLGVVCIQRVPHRQPGILRKREFYLVFLPTYRLEWCKQQLSKVGQ